MSYFSNLREQFKNFADISATQTTLINELNGLKSKPSLTTAEIKRYNEIIDALSAAIVSASDMNNICQAILNMENFLENQPLYYRGVYSALTAYVKNDLVRYEGSVYVCLANCTNVLPNNTSYWTIFVQRGGGAKLTTNGYTQKVITSVTKIGIKTTLPYVHGTDCLVVLKNGVYLQEGTDYEITVSTSTSINCLTGSWDGSITNELYFSFIVLKNIYID